MLNEFERNEYQELKRIIKNLAGRKIPSVTMLKRIGIGPSPNMQNVDPICYPLWGRFSELARKCK